MGEIQDKEIISELCGAIIGDGWIQSNERCFFLAGDPTEDRDYYDSHIPEIFRKVLITVTPKEFPYWSVYGISIYKKDIIQKLLSWNIPKGKKVDTARIPNWIKKSEDKVKKAFLRGFFDADGSIFCQKDYTKYAKEFNSKHHVKARLRITSISSNLVDEMKGMCEEVGFKVIRRTIKRGRISERNCKDIHIIEINHLESIRKWFEELKPSNPKHTTKYRIWKKFGFCPPKTTLIQRKEILKNELSPYSFYMQE